ncbi:MAG: hypothetical protein Ta2F_02880 [Termitinemataceae bacterium]|nr:MAG: hypothetical protein Ta2F_02880 [Termitinemataceae bacterium]
MDDEQFKITKELLEQIVENTKPPKKTRMILETFGLVVTIGGILSIIDQIFQWFWR